MLVFMNGCLKKEFMTTGPDSRAGDGERGPGAVLHTEGPHNWVLGK